MKKFIAFLLSSVLAFTIAMPSFAASPASSDTTRYTTDTSGNVYTIQETLLPNSDRKVTVTGPNGVSERIHRENMIYFTWTPYSGESQTWSVDTSAQPDTVTNNNGIEPYASSSIEGLEWGFSCKYDDSDESTFGIYWLLYSEDGGHVAYDSNNSTYRGYAETFWQNIISMNACIRDAKIAMAEYSAKEIAMVVSALAGADAAYEVITNALDAVTSDYASAHYWQSSREYANLAYFYFNRFQSATGSINRSV